jgi:hypothetical protein
VDDEGLETPAQLPRNHSTAPQSGAESGAVVTESITVDPDLQTVVGAWSALSTTTKVRILVMVREGGAGE